MSEQETVQKSDYDLELEEIEEAYDVKVKADDKFEHLAHKKIPRLTEILEKVQPDGTTLSAEDIANQILKDCKKYWSRNWIMQCMPDKFKREYDTTDTDDGDEDDTLPSTPSDNPQADLIKDLKQKLRNEEKGRTDAQRLYDKAHTKIEKLSAEMSEMREQLKSLKKGSKLLEIINPIYDEELNALNINVAGMSNTKLTTYFNDVHQTKPVDDPTMFVFKLGKRIVLESVD